MASNDSIFVNAFRASGGGNTPPQIVWGYPPGVSIVDTVPEDMRETIHPHWNQFPPVNPMWHYLLGNTS